MRSRIWHTIVAPALAATLTLCAGCASAKQPAAVIDLTYADRAVEIGAGAQRGADPVLNPDAAAILQRAGALLRGLDSYSFHARLSWSDVILNGVKVRFGGTLDAAVRRPGHLHVDYITDRDHKSLWYDGERLTLLSADHDVYGHLDVPGSIDDALVTARENHGVSVPLTNLLLSDPVADMDQRLEFGYLLGIAWVDGVPCHHLLFVEADLHWQVWIDAGDRPIPRQVAITYVNIPGQPEFLATLTEWSFDAKFDAQEFVAEIPETAMQIDWIDEEVDHDE